MTALDRMHAFLDADATLKGLVPGGVHEGFAPPNLTEPDVPGLPVPDYAVVQHLLSPKRRTSTSVHTENGVQVTAFTSDPGDGKTDAHGNAKAIVERVEKILEEADELLGVVAVFVDTVNYLEDDKGWQGVLTLRVVESRRRAVGV